MLSSLKFHFRNFISSRTEEIGRRIVSSNSEYRELSAKSIALHKSIRSRLPAEARELLEEYESVINLMRALACDAMYEQGLKDGMRLRRLLRGQC
ncbi:MAG: hypothetical protein QHH10_09990 [Peptococcaceae bacterium]|jgi:hypothetical protein|nr:hypothetical protein [Peptococcaceae bacterium]MDH7525631.1 hypothetical protein [Peptococcaceae bacterium]